MVFFWLIVLHVLNCSIYLYNGYSYGSYNRLVKTQNSSVTVNYGYDSYGNLVSESYGSTTINYNFDYENRLISAVKNGATLENNTYDGSGRLRASQSGSSSNFFMYDSGTTNIIYESNNHTNTYQDNFYADGLQVGQLTSSLSGGVSNYYYLQQDALGSTRLVTTASRSIAFSSDYFPFGENYGEGGTQSFMYTGRMYDSTAALYYLNARWYDTVVQRFMTEDSYSGSLEQPLSLNRHSYALDNPMKYFDPTGHKSASWLVENDFTFPASCWFFIAPPKSTGDSSSSSSNKRFNGQTSNDPQKHDPSSTSPEFWSWGISNHWGDFAQLVMIGLMAYFGPAWVIDDQLRLLAAATISVLSMGQDAITALLI